MSGWSASLARESRPSSICCLRLYDPQQGSIHIDGHDVRAFTQDSLHAQLGLIPQDPTLFHRSLRENIRYGRSRASDAEVEAAAVRAHADEFIRATPGGYDAQVGERGVKLSGGQRQRIAIARVILKDAPVLILDEATSSLDSITEQAIQAALDEAMAGKTVIVIAHRLSTIAHLDRILVFSNGRVVEDGNHAELLTRKGAYHQLWARQSDGLLPDGDEPGMAASQPQAGREPNTGQRAKQTSPDSCGRVGPLTRSNSVSESQPIESRAMTQNAHAVSPQRPISLNLDSAELAATYDEVSVRQFNHGKILIAELGPKPGERVLDIGCGTGRLGAYVADQVAPNGEVLGVDPLPLRIELAARKNAHFKASVGRAEDLSAFADLSFDAAYANSVFHWVQDKPKALRETLRVLKKGGRFGVNSANADQLHQSATLVREAVLEEGLHKTEAANAVGINYRVNGPELERAAARSRLYGRARHAAHLRRRRERRRRPICLE